MAAANRANHFDLLRLFAALCVFAAHGDFLYRLHLPVPFPGHSLGSLAVYVFFFISGYLVLQSWLRDPQWAAFWIKRLLRIFPGLVVAVAFSVFVLGWAVTTLPSIAYWSAPETWLNFGNNALGLATVQTLPGVFEANPFARAVNGSLWTIRYEVAMYLVMAVMAWTFRGQRWLYPAMALALVVLWEAARRWQWDAALEASGGPIADVFRWRDFAGFGVPFFLGSSLAAYGVRSRLAMLAVALVALPCALLAEPSLWSQIAVWLLVVCVTFYAAFAGQQGKATLGRGKADLSYGIYIYAFPVQQAVTELCLRQGWSFAVCVAISLVLVLALAWLSWRYVEQPCIGLAHRWVRARRALAILR